MPRERTGRTVAASVTAAQRQTLNNIAKRRAARAGLADYPVRRVVEDALAVGLPQLEAIEAASS